MEVNQIICGDCLEVMPNIPDKSIDMILCDLPYGTTACKWDTVIPFEPLWKEYKRLIKKNGAIVLFGSEPFSSALRMSNIKNYKYDWNWIKNKPSGSMTAKLQPMKCVENICIFCENKTIYNPIMIKRTKDELKRLSKKSVKTSGTSIDGREWGKSGNRDDNKLKYPRNTINIKTVSNRSKEKVAHPTQKPVALFEYLIKTYTNKGDLVLDNCAGSGTTGVACKNLGRKFILIEKEEKYVEIARRRIKSIPPTLF